MFVDISFQIISIFVLAQYMTCIYQVFICKSKYILNTNNYKATPQYFWVILLLFSFYLDICRWYSCFSAFLPIFVDSVFSYQLCFWYLWMGFHLIALFLILVVVFLSFGSILDTFSGICFLILFLTLIIVRLFLTPLLIFGKVWCFTSKYKF